MNGFLREQKYLIENQKTELKTTISRGREKKKKKQYRNINCQTAQLPQQQVL